MRRNSAKTSPIAPRFAVSARSKNTVNTVPIAAHVNRYGTESTCTIDLIYEFLDYYKTPRGRHPRSTSMWVARSADLLDQFDSFADVDKIAPRPLLMIAGTEAATLHYSEDAVEGIGENAELFTIEGATHVDLYDKDEYVTPAVDKLTEFFDQHLTNA